MNRNLDTETFRKGWKSSHLGIFLLGQISKCL